jgi:hypothetical protein
MSVDSPSLGVAKKLQEDFEMIRKEQPEPPRLPRDPRLSPQIRPVSDISAEHSHSKTWDVTKGGHIEEDLWRNKFLADGFDLPPDVLALVMKHRMPVRVETHPETNENQRIDEARGEIKKLADLVVSCLGGDRKAYAVIHGMWKGIGEGHDSMGAKQYEEKVKWMQNLFAEVSRGEIPVWLSSRLVA